MAERTIPFTRPTPPYHPGRRISFLEVVTAIAIVAALLSAGARATGRLPSARAIPTSGAPTRLIQMDGVWVDTATNPKRERFFRVLDPATGGATGETLPFHLPENVQPLAFSGDGRTFAYTLPSLAQPGVSVVDVATGMVRRTLTFDQPTFVMRLNGDGTRLVLYRFSTPNHPPFILLTVDLATGTTLSTVTLPSSSDAWPIITPDLRTAYVLDTHMSGTWPNVTSGDVTLDVIDTATGARQIVLLPFVHAGVFPENRTIQGEPVIRSLAPALTPSPDSARLYIVHANTDGITVINRREARVERNESIHPTATIARSLVGWLTPMRVAAKEAMESTIKRATLSPDGGTLVITGTTRHPLDTGGYDGTDLGVQFVNLRTFTEHAHIAPQDHADFALVSDVQFSADGRLLYIGNVMSPVSGGSNTTYQLRIMDARTHRIIATQPSLADPDTPVYLPEIWFALPQ